MRQIISENNQFRKIQKSIIRAIITKKNPIITIINTKNDKSLLFILSTLCEPKKTNIIVISLIALRKNLKKQCEKTKIRCTK